MRTITCEEITNTVAGLCRDANYTLGTDILGALNEALSTEESPMGKEILADLLCNAEIAASDGVPICQDTGIMVLFVKLGAELRVTGGPLETALVEGVRAGAKLGYLRSSVVECPLQRKNTQDNTPPVIHYQIISGDRLEITVMPKGAGSENMSALKMLTPAQGYTGVKEFLLKTVSDAGPNPCPPLLIGLGLGGTMEKAALLAKQSLLRPLDQSHPDPRLASFEKDLLQAVNKLGIGPGGVGGRITALRVHMLTYPTHIASLPVAVNLSCHASRHRTSIL